MLLIEHRGFRCKKYPTRSYFAGSLVIVRISHKGYQS